MTVQFRFHYIDAKDTHRSIELTIRTDFPHTRAVNYGCRWEQSFSPSFLSFFFFFFFVYETIARTKIAQSHVTLANNERWVCGAFKNGAIGMTLGEIAMSLYGGSSVYRSRISIWLIKVYNCVWVIRSLFTIYREVLQEYCMEFLRPK